MRGNQKKKEIRGAGPAALDHFMKRHGFEPYRAHQAATWIWKRHARSFEQMTNLPLEVRKLLDRHFYFSSCAIQNTRKSKDGSVKIVFSLHDGKPVEGVMIPAGKRLTACVSSQIGCPVQCTFCATGQMGLVRNLAAGEIFDQVCLLMEKARRLYNTTLKNLVFMGMGEPLLNYDQVMSSIDMISSPEMLGVSPQRITLSTVGIVKKINQLGRDRVKFNLALSLHTADQKKREKIIPLSKSNTLDQLSEALKYFYKNTGTRVTYEYLLMKDFNDSTEDARLLAEFCRITPCKINLIEYNPVPGTEYQRSPDRNTAAFSGFLKSRNLVVKIRKSRGADIAAACGQLATAGSH